MTQRLKVLVSAYACSPCRGSEPGVGWGFVQALSKHHDLHVIVEEEKFRDEIEYWQHANPGQLSNVHFHFLRKRRNRWLRRLWPPSYYWYYRDWQRQALRLARQLHAKEGFDLVHQLTMVGFREPGYLWQMGLPFVWGPVGGMGYFPWRFLPHVGLRGMLHYLGYNVVNALQMRWLRRPQLAARAAGRGLIAATQENAECARRRWEVEASILTEVGLPRPPGCDVSERRDGEPLRLVWSGQHTPGKALQLGLLALSRLPVGVSWTLDVLGQGIMTERWRRLTRRLGLGARVRFHGSLPRSAALQVMSESHVLLITSMRDLTSSVTVEGLALGLPTIAPDHCGFRDAITDACGMLVPVHDADGFCASLAAAVQRMAGNEHARQRLAHGALARAHTFAWDAKACAVSSIYRQLATTPTDQDPFIPRPTPSRSNSLAAT